MLAKLTIAFVLAVSALVPYEHTTTTETWTGWFSDSRCARVTDGTPRPNGTACVKKCLSEGAAPAFISEQAQAVFAVRDYPSIADEVGYHVEVTGVVDPTAKTISITSVKRLEEVKSTCAIPAKKDGKKR